MYSYKLNRTHILSANFWEGQTNAVTFFFFVIQLFGCWKCSRPCLGSAVDRNGWDRAAEGRDNSGSYKQAGHDRQGTNRCSVECSVLLRRPDAGIIQFSLFTLHTVV